MKIEQFITQCFSSVRYKSKRRGDPLPAFSKDDLRKWLYKNGLREKWIVYIESGLDKNKRPSINRIDDYGRYEFENMELIEWRDNHLMGVNSKKHHERTAQHNKKYRLKCFIFSKDGRMIRECPDYYDAAEYLNVHYVSVSRAVNKKRKTLKGYVLSNSPVANLN